MARLGILRWLDAWAARSRTGTWVRSLLAVYDVEDLVALDVPWWTFDAGGRVDDYLRQHPDARVLEWGSGASTVWLAKRSASVTSIEHDGAWAEVVRALAPAHADIRHVPPTPIGSSSPPVRSLKAGYAGLDFSDYVAAIDGVDGEFDVIVVDGRARAACLERAGRRLRPGGLIVVDNVERARYRQAIERLGPGVTVIWTRGLTPCLPYPTRTALLFPAAPLG